MPEIKDDDGFFVATDLRTSKKAEHHIHSTRRSKLGALFAIVHAFFEQYNKYFSSL